MLMHINYYIKLKIKIFKKINNNNNYFELNFYKYWKNKNYNFYFFNLHKFEVITNYINFYKFYNFINNIFYIFIKPIFIFSNKFKFEQENINLLTNLLNKKKTIEIIVLISSKIRFNSIVKLKNLNLPVVAILDQNFNTTYFDYTLTVLSYNKFFEFYLIELISYLYFINIQKKLSLNKYTYTEVIKNNYILKNA